MNMYKITFFLLSPFLIIFIYAEKLPQKEPLYVVLKSIPEKPHNDERCLCARKWIKEAKKGGLDAMLELANCYDLDTEVFLLKKGKESQKCITDTKLRAAWLGAAATRGYAPAQYQYGILYFFGVGVSTDKENAANWMDQSAKQGYPDAYFTLGEIYQFGLGRPKNLEKAIKYFKKASSLGVTRADKRLKELN